MTETVFSFRTPFSNQTKFGLTDILTLIIFPELIEMIPIPGMYWHHDIYLILSTLFGMIRDRFNVGVELSNGFWNRSKRRL